MTRPLRAWLFVPGNRPERFAKALASGADAVIIDLEDAVSPDAKDNARAALIEWLRGNPAAPRRAPVWVRINSVDTPWFAEDLAVAALPGLAGVMLPKAETEAAVARVVAAGASAVMPLMESAAGFDGLRSIAWR
ncbi:MAG: aldolase/citrate lyase family protein, partial [Ideonella sp.]